MNMQALQPVVSRIWQPFVLQLMPSTVQIVKGWRFSCSWFQHWWQLAWRQLWNVVKTFNVISTVSLVSKSVQISHLDLTNYDSAVYEMKDGIPGMKFTVDGRDGWIPVRKRCCQTKSKMPQQRSVSSDTESSSSDIDVSCCRRVEYSVHDSDSGLTVFRRNAIWTPIEPSPVASRLRTKSRFKYPKWCT